MIAFPQEELGSRDRWPHPIMMVSPQLMMRTTNGTPDASDAGTRLTEYSADRVATPQQELAMLQRALVRCGLIGIRQDDKE